MTDHPPTVATAAAATPSPVDGHDDRAFGAGSGADTGEVEPDVQLGGDDAAHRGGDVTFSANGGNTAKNTTATFSQAGTYGFTVTITDPGGLTATSSVSVTVNQTLTAIAVSPATVSLNAAADAAVHGHGLGPVRRGDERAADVHLDDHGGYDQRRRAVLTASNSSAHGHGDGGSRRDQRQQHGDGHGPPADGGHGGQQQRPARSTGTTTAFRCWVPRRYGRGEPDLQLGGDDAAHRGGDALFSATAQRGEEHHGHLQPGGNLRLHGDDHRPGRTDGHQQRQRDGEPDADGDHGGPGVGRVSTRRRRSSSRRRPTTSSARPWPAADVHLDDDGGDDQHRRPVDGRQQFGQRHGDGQQRRRSAARSAVTVTNHPPTVATAASATPSPVTGTTTSLSVLGADDDTGESSLTYTWAATTLPTGAARHVQRQRQQRGEEHHGHVQQGGNYGFTVTITDPGGLTATSSVSVTVNQTLTAIAVEPGVGRASTRRRRSSSRPRPWTSSARPDQRSRRSPGRRRRARSTSAGCLTAPNTFGHGHGDGRQRRDQRQQRGDGHGPAADGGHGGQRPRPARSTGTTTALSVLGADDDTGESSLTYSWAATTLPTGAATPRSAPTAATRRRTPRPPSARRGLTPSR